MFRTTNFEDGLQKMINFTKQTCAIHKKHETYGFFACFVSGEIHVKGGASSSSDVSCSIGTSLVHVSAQTPVTLTGIVRYFPISSGQILS
jgi:hypothetical protein